MSVETRAEPKVRVNCRGCSGRGVQFWNHASGHGQICELCNGTGAKDLPPVVLTATTQFTEYKGRAISRATHVRVPGILDHKPRTWLLTYDQFLEQVREAKVIPWTDDLKKGNE